MSALIRYCEGAIEAAWLAALVCVPLFFSAWGEAVQSEKNYLLRSLAIFLATAWTIKTAAELWSGATKPKSLSPRVLLRTPLLAAAMILGISWAVATLLSLSPWDSFWGVYFVRDGSYTYFSCLLFFAAIAANARSDEQVNRMITAAILTSIPISLYGIGQRFSLEPVIITRGRDLVRVGSTLGNAIFLAAYLMMIVPLALSQMIGCFEEFRVRSAERRAPLIQGGAYGLIALLQITAMVFTVSRGPLLGLFAGIFILVMLLAIYWRKPWIAMATIGGGLLMFAALFVLLGPIGRVSRIAERPEIKRFVEMLDPRSGSSGRAEIWHEAAQAARFSKKVQTVEGLPDRFASLRFLVGYGPESVVTVNRLYRSKDYNVAMPDVTYLDRFHNDVWDTVITVGTFGAIASLTLDFLILYYACKWLGLISSRRTRAIFWWLVGGGGVGGCLGAVMWQGLGFLGVGLRLGTIAGMLGFLIWICRHAKAETKIERALNFRTLTLMALVSGLAAHLVEISFLFTTETTLLYFWTYVALLLVVGDRLPGIETLSVTREKPALNAIGNFTNSCPPSASQTRNENSETSRTGESRTAYLRSKGHSLQTDATSGLLIALFLMNLGFMLIRHTEAPSAIMTIVHALTRLPGNDNAFTWAVLLASVLMVVLFAIILANETRASSSRTWMQSFGAIVAISVTIALGYWFALATHAVGTVDPSDASLSLLHRLLGNYTFVVDFHYAFLFFMILLLAAFLAGERPLLKTTARRSGVFAGFASVLAIACAVGIYSTNMKWSKLGVANNLIDYFSRDKQWPLAAALCETAIKRVPRDETLHLKLGRTLTEQAALGKDPEQRRALFLKGDHTLEIGHKLRPLNPAHLVEHGNLYLKWGLTENDREKKRAIGMKAIEFFQQAVVLDPADPETWNKMAYVRLVLLGSLDEAQRLILRSIDLFPNSHRAYCLYGDVLSQHGLATTNRGDRTAFFRSAAANYQRALQLIGTNSDSAHLQHLYATSLGKSWLRLREWPQAITAYQRAVLVAPATERWSHEETLARLFADVKDRTSAAEHAQRAIDLAPADKRAGLVALRNKILSIFQEPSE